MSEMPHKHEALDTATSRRLAKLRDQPVDTSALERRLNAALAPPGIVTTRRPYRWLSPIIGMAAALLIAAGVLLVISSGGTEASAAIVELSHLHRDIVSGRIAMTPVETIEKANQWIAEQAANGPHLPDALGPIHVQSCCLAEVQGDLVAVVLMRLDSASPITLVVADAPGFAREMGKVIEIDGRRFFGHRVDGVNMVMANAGDRWLCVMGDADSEQLARIASKIQL